MRSIDLKQISILILLQNLVNQFVVRVPILDFKTASEIQVVEE